MPSPPLSPKPQRWRARTDEPHPDIQALLSSVDNPPTSERNRGNYGARSEPEHAPPRSVSPSRHQHQHRRAESDVVVPEIRTTSPEPTLRRRSPSALSARSTQHSLSPLEPPSRGDIFGTTSQDTAGRNLMRGGSVSGPRVNLSSESSPPRYPINENNGANTDTSR